MLEYTISDIVEEHITEEFKRLQEKNTYLKQLVEEGNDEVYCAVCGEKIESLSIQRKTRPILWHSKHCFRWKPRKIVKLERDYGKDIVEILKETTAKCGNIKSQCDVLDVSIPYLYSIIKKYCGPDLIRFMADNGTGNRKKLYDKKLSKRKY